MENNNEAASTQCSPVVNEVAKTQTTTCVCIPGDENTPCNGDLSPGIITNHGNKTCYYQIVLSLVDGAWSTWGEWDACTVTCGGAGTQTRTRTCDNPAPVNGGAQCTGESTENQACDMGACPSKL